ncbi:hypothetical protein AB0O34_13460 [Sphaerisporangium sp. NPDC088356]|uniref:hypothetical protein n=1 Tax=Sphaerisporangium sp. NPDC088356 TaxID=3154871 RepID=UPI00342935C4
MTGPRRDDDHQPQELWTWSADDLNGRTVRGVTNIPGRARRALLAALNTMPNKGEGTIRQAWLDVFAYPYPCYRYGPVLMHAYRDKTTGVIVLQDGPPSIDVAP